MSSIDKRVVEMQFNNQQFEKGIQTSVKSLDNLKKGLDLDKAAKGLSNLERAGKSFSLAGLADGVSTISSRFSALGIIGVTALQNITNSAINAGKRIVSALTIDPVKTGFSEYETQINAVQTILANTSSEMDKAGLGQQERLDLVSAKLDELNHYADKTIYNFTEMTRNIGTFTAAGIDLETSVRSIQGIANLAAVSGSTSQQASTAMYQLSQALSTGTVKLQDWNSVVNAGMGGKVFQDALVETARVMGVTIDKTETVVNKKGKKIRQSVKKTVDALIAEEGSFRASLSSGWLTSDVLTKTLDHFAMDFEAIAKASGITVEAAKEIKKAELIAEGYTSDQADGIIKMAETAAEAATKVKTFTQLFDTLKEAAQSGWTQTWELIVGDFEEAKALLTDIGNYFGTIIGASADSRNAIVGDWKALGGRNELIEGFWNIVRSIENVVKIFKGAFEEFFPPTTGQQLFDITKKFSAFTERLKAFTENSEVVGKMQRVFRGVAAALDIARTAANWAWQSFMKLVGAAEPASGSFLDFVASIGDFIVGIRDSIKNSETFQKIITKFGVAVQAVRRFVVDIGKAIGTVFGDIWAKVNASGVLTKIGEGFGSFLGMIPNAIEKLKGWGKSVIDYVKNSEMLQNAWAKVKDFAGPIIEKIKQFAIQFKNAIKAFFEADTSGEEGLGGKLKARLAAFVETFAGWFEGIKAGATKAWNKVKDFFSNFFSKTIPSFFSSLSGKLGGFLGDAKNIDFGSLIKNALGIVTAIKMLTFIGSFAKIGKGLKTIGKSLGQIGEGIKDVVKNGVNITKKNKDSLGSTLLKIAAAIGILVASIYVLSKMDEGEIIKGLGVLTILAMELLAISVVFGKVGADGKSFLMVAAAITLLVLPIKMLGSMDTETAIKGLVGVGIILTELALFMRLAGKGFSGKTAFITMAVAVNLLVLAVKGLADLSVGGILKGLVGLEVIFLVLSRFMKKTGKLGKVSGLIGMAVAVNLLVFAVKRMGQMKTTTLVKGIVAISALLASFSILTQSANGASFGKSVLMLLTIAGTLILFIEAFKQLDGIDATSMLSFSVSLSAILIALSVAMKLMSSIPITGALMGVANLAIAIAGIGLIVVALGALQNDWKGMTNFLEAGGNVLGQIGRAIGMFIGGIGDGIVEGLDLPGMGTELSGFMTNVQPFLEGVRGVDESVKTGVMNLAAALLAIGGAEFVNTLVSLFTGENPVSKFAGDLKTLGSALCAYALSVAPLGTVPQTTLDRSISVASALADVASKVPATGGIVGLLTGIGDLGTFAANVGLLGKALVGFAVEISGINGDAFDQTKIDAVVAVATGLAALEKNLEGQGGLEDTFEGIKSLSKFSEGFSPFAKGVNSFITEVREIDYDPSSESEKLASVIEIGKALADLEQNLGAQGGWVDAITGIKSLSKFSEGMKPFAVGLNKFVGEVRQINYDPITESNKLQAVIEIGKALSDLENSLQGQGGWADAIVGIQSLANFGSEIPDFATGLNGFLSIVSNLNDKDFSQEKIDKAIATATAINSFQKQLPSTDGWWQSVIGMQDLGLFSTNVKSVGEALASFASSIGTVDMGNSENAFSVLESINSFVAELNSSGGLWANISDWFSGTKTETLLETVGNMKTVGDSLKSFSTNITGLDTTGVATASTIFEAIQTFMSGLENSGGFGEAWDKFWGGGKDNTLIAVAANMAIFGTNMKTFGDGIANAISAETNFEAAKRLFAAFNTFNDEVAAYSEIDYSSQMSGLLWLLGDFGKSLASFALSLVGIDVSTLTSAASVIETIVALAGSASTISDTSLTSIQTILNNFASLTIPDFQTSGTDSANAYLDGLALGIQNGVSSLTGAVSVLSSYGSTAANATYDTWFKTGQNLAQGLGNGISSMASSIRSAAVGVAAGAVKSIQMTWSVHSPSVVGENLGMYFDLGIAGGLDAYAKVVAHSATGVGNSVVDSAKSALSTFTANMTDGIDATPTIRPVIDMSNVTSGVNTINGLFNANRSLNAGAFSGAMFNRNAAHMNFDGARIVGSASNKDVVHAIGNLTERFNNLSSAVANIKLVLDTGTLVGQLDTKIDKQLNVLAGRRERGN